MMWKLDESVGKVTAALARRKMLQQTTIVFLSDNGAPTLDVGVWRNWGSNHPLRGVKGTHWEGGVRGIGFIWSRRLRNAPRVSTQLMHVTDWLPTLYKAAGGNPENLNSAKLDGVDQWDALVYDTPSRRDKVLLQLDEVLNFTAVRKGQWKLVSGSSGKWDGYSGGSVLSTNSPPYDPIKVLQSLAGVALEKVKSNMTVARILQLRKQATLNCSTSANNTSCDTARGSCLFDLSEDPCEMNDLSAEQPRHLQDLTELLKNYTVTVVPQSEKRYNLVLANPARFNNVWSPWEN